MCYNTIQCATIQYNIGGYKIEINGTISDVRFIRIVALKLNDDNCNKFLYYGDAFPFKSNIGYQNERRFKSNIQKTFANDTEIKFGYQIMYRIDKQFKYENHPLITNKIEIIPDTLEVMIKVEPSVTYNGFVTSSIKLTKLWPLNFNKIHQLNYASLQVF